MSNIKILIVDDEHHSRQKIHSFLKNEQSPVIIDESDNGEDAVYKFIRNISELYEKHIE